MMSDRLIGSGIVCKGSVALGSGCGRCDRCLAEHVRLDVSRVEAGARVLLESVMPSSPWDELHPDKKGVLRDLVRAIVDAVMA